MGTPWNWCRIFGEKVEPVTECAEVSHLATDLGSYALAAPFAGSQR